jgi:hypothetical protein
VLEKTRANIAIARLWKKELASNTQLQLFGSKLPIIDKTKCTMAMHRCTRKQAYMQHYPLELSLNCRKESVFKLIATRIITKQATGRDLS